MTTLVPDLDLDRRGVQRGVAVSMQDGHIVAVGPPPEHAPIEELPGLALVPGFWNNHCHAFQRDLRGRTEQAGGDFWSWRAAMYELAARLEPDSVHDVARRCYRELVAAGYTAVSEFHYLHHRSTGLPYADPNAMAKAVVEAAEDVGIRITLLLVAYERDGHARFRDPDVATYLDRLEALSDWVEDRPLADVGAAPHSVRAVGREWLEAIAKSPFTPVSIHVDEQPREIEECIAEHGCRPIELLDRVGLLRPDVGVVHATHADGAELALVAAAGSNVCVCPTTEADLADGPVPTEALLESGVDLTIGSDSNVVVDPLAELREIELSARRATGRRGVVPLTVLLDAAWPFDVTAGAPADLVAFDLNHPSIAGIDDADLAAGLVFSGTPAAFTATWVAGRRVFGR
jgi:formimidoylglutamate deiminase